MNEQFLEGDDWKHYKPARRDITELFEGDDWSLRASIFRKCKRCGAAFVRVMRQEYCTIACSQAQRNENKRTNGL
jgi:hypothetical protein